MGFCRQCGADIGTSGFCASCGTSVIGDILDVQRQNMAAMTAEIRRQNLAEMRSIVDYFCAKQAVFVKVEALTHEVNMRKERGYYGWLIFALLLFLPVLLMVIPSGEGFFESLFVTVILGIPAMIPFTIFLKLRKRNFKKLEIAEKELDKARRYLAEYYVAYGDCPLGPEYTFPDTLWAIYDEMRQGKASTIEDALNSYLDGLYKAKVEREMKQTREQLNRIEQSSQKAAEYAEATYWHMD